MFKSNRKKVYTAVSIAALLLIVVVALTFALSGWWECRIGEGSQGLCQTEVDQKLQRDGEETADWSNPSAAYTQARKSVSHCTAAAAAYWDGSENDCYVSPTVTVSPTIEPSLTPSPTLTITPTETITPTIAPSLTPSPTTTIVPTETITPTIAPTVEASTTPAPTNEPTPNSRPLACLRINFDIGEDVARRGTYVVKETGGKVLATWWADTGWQDSGWIEDIDITFPAVYVQVFFVKGDGTEIEMKILNPAPQDDELNPLGTYGWVARGSCHAIEVKWPVTQPIP